MFKKIYYIVTKKFVMIKRQSAAKPLKELFSNEEGSTTIPRKGSKVEKFSLEKPDAMYFYF